MSVGTPDFQYGVVNSQQEVGTVPAGTSSVLVGIPPNAETLVVAAPGVAAADGIYCQGQTTNLNYPGVAAPLTRPVIAHQFYFFDISMALDAQVRVQFVTAPTTQWYVYADAGLHNTYQQQPAQSASGVQYTIPTVPDTASGDHPPNELSVAAVGSAVSVNVVPAPGAGLRLRLFSAVMINDTAGSTGYLTNGVGGTALCAVNGPGNVALALPDQGFPLSTNQPLYYSQVAGTGGTTTIVYYTTETF